MGGGGGQWFGGTLKQFNQRREMILIKYDDDGCEQWIRLEDEIAAGGVQFENSS